MRNTKYLWDDAKNSPEGMVSVSQLQSFMSCPKKWEYGYIEGLTPRVEREFLTIGKLCHKGMQIAMQSKWKDEQAGLDTGESGGLLLSWQRAGELAMEEEWAGYMSRVPFLPEEVPAVEQVLTDAKSVFRQAFKEFDPYRYTVRNVVKNGLLMPALELHFVVPCTGSKGLHGYIDAILYDKETGFTWCTDYKFRKSLSPDDDETYNVQNAVYTYACRKMDIAITGTMTWQHLNTPAADPQLLKDGKVSRAKIKTSWEHYAAFCEAHGESPLLYQGEMEPKLADIEWHRETYEHRNDWYVKSVWQQVIVPAARKVKSAYTHMNQRNLYPWNCKMCQFKDLCQAELRGYDAMHMRQTDFVKRSHANPDKKPVDSSSSNVI